ncbi:MAG: Rod shape-determining protein RodA [Thermoleophilia bacterium]|jgi:rod shape determining protein RodA|nr:Rod shape-determining protein RodA [Thermoleophilia bacterium]
MGSHRRILGIDATLVLSALAIIGVCLYVLSNAIVRPDGGLDASFAHRQALFAVIGLGIAAGVSRIPISFWQRFWPHAMVLTIVLLVMLRLVGTVVNGSRRWIDLGPVSLQPSEFGKFLMLITVAGFLASRHREIREARTFLAGLAMLGVPAIIVFLQPDFGTAQVYGYLALGALFFAGARWLHFAVLGGSVVVAAVLVLAVLPAVGLEVLHDFQKQRLTGFLDPEADPQGTNYQSIQAKTAIGSGGISGRASGEASQVQQGFLPEPQTDFVFATHTERYGFIGAVVVLGLYMLLISRILYAVGVAANPYSRLIAGGVAMLFFCQVFINVGMVIGVLPVTGVPLPMFSYGGSSLWTNMALLGLVIAVLREAETPGVRYQRRTGRPTAGFGSLRATSLERSSTRRRTAPSTTGMPFTAGSGRRRTRRRT